MADGSGIDPRYAAQFQRGFDPERHAVVERPAPDVREQPVRIAGGPPPTAPRVADRPPPVARVSEPPVDAGAEAALTEPEDVLATADGHPGTDLVLPFAGVALAALAVALWLGSAADATQYYIGPDQDDAGVAFWRLVRTSLPDELFVGGVLAATVGILLPARRRPATRRRIALLAAVAAVLALAAVAALVRSAAFLARTGNGGAISGFEDLTESLVSSVLQAASGPLLLGAVIAGIGATVLAVAGRRAVP